MCDEKNDQEMFEPFVETSEVKVNLTKLRAAGRVERLKSKGGVILLDRSNPQHRELFEGEY
ncbi:hypothetical protein [Alicyclobacillus fastidiosus]|uniref:Uncharacterized protein n=1 Tax=Alicyclobacillus fastidiosus TaxID=392011 RepID=A0ABV5AL95_9BACL